jgi:GTP-binding protein
LARVYVLIDGRHGLKTADDAVLKTLDVAAVSYQIVLTKGDQVPAKELETRLADTAAAIKKRAAAFPDILVTSSREGTGMPELRATIARMVAERS